MSSGKTAIVVLFASLIGRTPACLANNNLFLPGDAYFPTVLTRSGIENLQKAKTGERRFTYASFGGYVGAFCGYAGYLKATIPAVDDPFAKNLDAVYRRIREFQRRELYERKVDGKTELVETNGIRVLFYPADFEFPRHALGLRYNENWVDECVKFGHRKEHLRLCSLVPDPEAVARSWRDAELVPALKVELPDVPLKPVPPTDAPVTVQGQVKAIALGSHTLEQLLNPGYDDQLTIYIIDSKFVTELEYYEGKWQPGDVE